MKTAITTRSQTQQCNEKRKKETQKKQTKIALPKIIPAWSDQITGKNVTIKYHEGNKNAPNRKTASLRLQKSKREAAGAIFCRPRNWPLQIFSTDKEG